MSAYPASVVAEIHGTSIVVDAHNDLLTLVARRPPHDWGSYFRNNWLPQLQEGGVDVQVLPIYIDDIFRPEGALRETLRMIEAAYRLAHENADEVNICISPADITATIHSGRIALVLALEGCPQVGEDIELLETFARLGVQMVSLAHFGRSPLADGSGEDATGSRLTAAGVDAVALLESRGVLLDISHLSRRGVDHVLEIATRPVVASHSSARAVRDHHRNLDDRTLAAIAATGGVVCVNFQGGYLTDGTPTIAHLVEHITHIVEVAGPDHVGIGADFFHEIVNELLPRWCERPLIAQGIDMERFIPSLTGPRGLPLVTSALLNEGVEVETITKILGANMLRVMTAST